VSVDINVEYQAAIASKLGSYNLLKNDLHLY